MAGDPAARAEQQAMPQPVRLLVGDIGGTHARLGVMDVAGADRRLLALRRYACADAADLAALLRRFQTDEAASGAATATVAVLAIAGVVEGDQLLSRNLPWPVSLTATRRDAGMSALYLINDFEALAWAVPGLAAAQRRTLDGTDSPAALPLPALVLGPGTGLGAAVVVDVDGAPRVLPSEAGQAALAPGTALEIELLRVLQARFGHVACERVVSGPGLVNLYQALAEVRGCAAQAKTPADVVAAVHQGEALASECVALFCQWWGGVAGDLALTFRARAVCLAGGLTVHLGDALRQGGFRQRFADKGVLSEALRQVPVCTVEDDTLALVGAAAWYVARRPG
ncbi:glucokinase [Thermomonas hydrothermalis]|nr:glucokinase [Thermomonas hydrothermalis]